MFGMIGSCNVNVENFVSLESVVLRILPALYTRDTPFHRDDSVGK